MAINSETSTIMETVEFRLNNGGQGLGQTVEFGIEGFDFTQNGGKMGSRWYHFWTRRGHDNQSREGSPLTTRQRGVMSVRRQ